MLRHNHYLRRSKHAGYPKRQAAVVVRFARIPNERCPGIGQDVLLAWRAVSWSGDPGLERWESEGEGVTEDTFWRWIRGQLARRRQLWVWFPTACHCLTLLGFWRRITEGEYVISKRDARAPPEDATGHDARGGGLCVVSDPPTIVVASPAHGPGSVRLLDLRNLGVSGPGAMGASPDDPRALASWLQQWSRTVEELNLGGLRCTAAAQAWHGWRYSYLDEGILIHDNPDALAMERASIYPGRCESYRIGLVDGGATGYDASAFYPACAVATTSPCRLKWCGACDANTLRRAIERGWLAITECRVRCREPILPCRIDKSGSPTQHHIRGLEEGNRQRSADRTIWPLGEWVGTFAGPELALAERSNCLVSVLRAALYEQGRPFDSFVSRLWDARQRAHGLQAGAAEQCIKLLMNSLVGKLAAREHSWVDEPLALPPGPWQSWCHYGSDGKLRNKYRTVGWHAQRLVTGGETAESCPALASWIYSTGRVQLWEWMETAGRENVYYVDSDSLLVSACGAACLSGETLGGNPSLGALRVQGVYASLRIGGVKDYATESKRVSCGIPPGFRDTVQGQWAGWRGETVHEAIHSGQPPGLSVRRVVLPVFRPYRHGSVGADGKVSPLEV